MVDPMADKKTPSPVGGNQTIRPLTPEAKQRIKDAYEAGVGINGIAATFGHARTTVRKILRNSTITLRDDGAKPKITRDDLIKRHNEGWTVRQIADSCGADVNTIRQRLVELNLPTSARTLSLPVGEIVAARRRGQSAQSLADEYGVHRETISRLLAASGLAPSKSLPGTNPLKLADLCRRGLSVAEMSAATGVYSKTLRKHLAAAGLRAADKRPGRERPAVVPEEFRRLAG